MMSLALEEAKKAAALGETPVGAVLTGMERYSSLRTTCGKLAAVQLPMLNCWQLNRPAENWADGGCTVRYYM